MEFREFKYDESYRVYSERMARWLINRCFTVVAIMHNKRHPEKIVYCFQDSEPLRKAIQIYIQEHGKYTGTHE